MIYLIHQNNAALKVLDTHFQEISFAVETSITKTIFKIAAAFPRETIIWCHQAYQEFINTSALKAIFHHNYILVSYSVSSKYCIPDSIGYIDQSVFLNVKKQVCYPTWLMSSNVGGVSSQFLNLISKDVKKADNFDYFLNSLAKLSMIQGLFCYSEPKLLKEYVTKLTSDNQESTFQLFKFVKQHYKWVWVFMLFLCFLIYEKRLLILPLLKSLCYKKTNFKFQLTNIKSNKNTAQNKDVDVIIPTIGRKSYLNNVLKDLANQTLLPKNVIIVEQNPLPESISELQFLTSEQWPFNIKHTFTHQSGVCNARNLAISQVESDWVFFNDDDNRFDSDVIQSFFDACNQLGVLAITSAYLQENETLLFNNIHQTGIFGSGNSFLKTSCLDNIKFDMALEFGYGEDFDFGMQLRNQGIDVVYCPDIKITHLKAPFGGFRTKIKQLWDDDTVQPKPSPTIMYTFLKHYTQKQLLNYKLVLFLRLLKKESIFNYARFFKNFQKKWQASIYWAEKLMRR